MPKIKKVTVLGATGTIGTIALEMIRESEEVEVEVLTAHSNWKKLYELALIHKPSYVGITDCEAGKKLKSALKGTKIDVFSGKDNVKNAVEREVDTVLVANSGSDCIEAIIKASKNTEVLAMANKESIVCGGEFLIDEIKKNGAKLLPVDSEHNALFRMNLDRDKSFVKKIIITASGGPFLKYPRDKLDYVTPEQATKHPNWKMGKKISVDSATLMNKALEVIEAANIFGIDPKSIEIMIHEKSIVHAILVKKDNSLLASMSKPDMRGPIWHALHWPELKQNPFLEDLDLFGSEPIVFSKADTDLFPSLKLLDQVVKVGGTSPIVFSISNDYAVKAFLKGFINFTEIIVLVENCLQTADIKRKPQSIGEMMDCIRTSRIQIENNVSSFIASKN